MGNPVTDGQLENEGAGTLGRLASVLIASALLVVGYQLGLFKLWRIRVIFLGTTLAATAFVWFPDYVAAWVSLKQGDREEPPASAIRIVGWVLLALMAGILGTTWVRSL